MRFTVVAAEAGQEVGRWVYRLERSARKDARILRGNLRLAVRIIDNATGLDLPLEGQ